MQRSTVTSGRLYPGIKWVDQAVIGIDLESWKNKGMEAKVMICRPRHVEDADGIAVLEAAQRDEGNTFRAEDGSLVNGKWTFRIGLQVRKPV